MADENDPVGTSPPDPGSALDAGLKALFSKESGARALERPSVLETLEKVLESVPRVLLRAPAGGAEAEAAAEATAPWSSGEIPPTSSSRYQLQGEIARGGMGVVVRGRDTDLGRDLAVKILLSRHGRKPELRQRFFEEAQIGGQLQHPGVVPVYELGEFPGGRPFFTMKLVKGQTLAALLAARSSLGHDRPRFVKIFEQVCQTLAYAHARGVIHRDLKPSNVMVGAFGEVQVMDWGLAKVLREGGVDDEKRAKERFSAASAIKTARSAGSAGSETQAGSVMGTPSYMAPEQARGEVALVDERADVFGLGAILCEVLTGEPPFRGSTEEAERRAQRGDVRDARERLGKSGADLELVALAERCLEPEPADRPRHAGEVAAELARHRESVAARLRTAELEAAAERARAAEAQKRTVVERRARRITQALGAAVLLAIAVGGGGWHWVKSARDASRSKAAAEIAGAFERAAALLDQARKAPEDLSALSAARVEAERARSLLQALPDGVGRSPRPDLWSHLAEDIGEEWQDRTLLLALDEARLAGSAMDSELGRFAEGRTVLGYRAAFADWGLSPGQREVAKAAERIRARPEAVKQEVFGSIDDWIRITEGKQSTIAEPHLGWLRGLLSAADTDPWRRAVREAPREEKDPTKRKERLVKLAREVELDRQPVVALRGLSLKLLNGGARDEAIRLLERSWQRSPGDFWVNQTLGMVWLDTRHFRYDSAEQHFAMAAAARPRSPGALLNLGVALINRGNPQDAIRPCEMALELAPADPLIAANLAAALLKAGRTGEGSARMEMVCAAHPRFAVSHFLLGRVYLDQGKLEESAAAYRRGLDLESADGDAWFHFATVLEKLGRAEDAIAAYREAIKAAPGFARVRSDLAGLLFEQGKLEESLALALKALELDPDLPEAHAGLGLILSAQGKTGEALAPFRRAIELNPTFVEAYHGLGQALLKLGKIEEAIGAYQKVVELQPSLAAAHDGLGNVYLRLNRCEEASACYQRAVLLDPSDPEAHCNLGHSLRELGRFSEALVEIRRCHELGSKRKDWEYPTTDWLKEAEVLAELEKRLDPVLTQQEPAASGPDLCRLADLAAKKRRFTDAARLIERSLAAQGELADPMAQVQRWYQGVWCGVLAGSERDLTRLDDAERARWRAGSRAHLRASLNRAEERLRAGGSGDRKALAGFLEHAINDPDTAGVRAGAGLAQLPPEEAEAWNKLWSDARALLEKAGGAEK